MMTPSKALLRRVATPSRLLRLTATSPSFHSTIASPRRATIVRLLPGALPSPSRRWNSSGSTPETLETPDYLNEAELKIFNMLKDELQPSKLEVQDISGGCGSMYGLDIVSDKFKGLTVIKQHRLVNKILGEEIKKWHGVQLKTKAP